LDYGLTLIVGRPKFEEGGL